MNSRSGVLERNKYFAEDVYSDIENPYASSTSTGTLSDADLDILAIQKKYNQQTSEATQQQTTNKVQVKETAVAKAAVSTKTKVAIVAYIAVVLLAIIGISFCGVAVSGAFKSMAALEGEYATVSGDLAELEALINADNYEELAKRAEELGFIDANDATSHTYELLETRPAQNFKIDTNWFDQLCDWLSGVFGG